MTLHDPYKKFLSPPTVAPMAVASKALTAFSRISAGLEDNDPDPKRVEALLRKVFGDDYQYAAIKDPDDLPGLVKFDIDGIELVFHQGTVPEEDVFSVTYAGISLDDNIRTLGGLGAAMSAAIDLAQASMEMCSQEEIKDHYKAMLEEGEEDEFDDDEEEDE